MGGKVVWGDGPWEEKPEKTWNPWRPVAARPIAFMSHTVLGSPGYSLTSSFTSHFTGAWKQGSVTLGITLPRPHTCPWPHSDLNFCQTHSQFHVLLASHTQIKGGWEPKKKKKRSLKRLRIKETLVRQQQRLKSFKVGRAAFLASLPSAYFPQVSPCPVFSSESQESEEMVEINFQTYLLSFGSSVGF